MPSRAALVNNPLGIAHDDIREAHAQLYIVLGAGDAARSRAVEHDLHPIDALARQIEGVQQRGARNNGGAMLVVVEHRDLHGAAQLFLDVEAFRRLDIFEIDAPESGLDQLAGANDLVGVLGGELDIEDIDIREALEQDPLAFHDGLTGRRADIAESEDRGAVADHGHEVALGRVLIDQAGVARDFETRHGHSGRVGQAQIALRPARFGGNGGHLSRGRRRVVGESFFRQNLHIQIILLYLEVRNHIIDMTVVAFAALIFLACIFSPPNLMDDVDAVQPQIARNMLQSGDWVTPRLDGIAYLEKPPLKYWMMAVSFLIFGVHDWAARLPVALAAVLLCW